MIRDCESLGNEKAKKVDSDKLKKLVQQNVLICELNDMMERNNKTYFTDNHIHKTLHLIFIR